MVIINCVIREANDVAEKYNLQDLEVDRTDDIINPWYGHQRGSENRGPCFGRCHTSFKINVSQGKEPLPN